MPSTRRKVSVQCHLVPPEDRSHYLAFVGRRARRPEGWISDSSLSSNRNVEIRSDWQKCMQVVDPCALFTLAYSEQCTECTDHIQLRKNDLVELHFDEETSHLELFSPSSFSSLTEMKWPMCAIVNAEFTFLPFRVPEHWSLVHTFDKSQEFLWRSREGDTLDRVHLYVQWRTCDKGLEASGRLDIFRVNDSSLKKC
jgi:hypothetical protein